MTDTLDTTTHPVPGNTDDSSTRPATTPADPWLRRAGAAGLMWAAILVVTNIVNGAVAPDPDADATTVMQHLADDRVALAWVSAGFVVGIPLVVFFMSGVARALVDRGMQLAAWVAILGFAGVAALFGMVAATRLSLVAAVETETLDPSAIWTMWKLHDVVFGFNAAMLSVTFAAVGVAAASVGLVPRWFRVVAPIGGGLLLVSALLTLQSAEGGMAGLAFGGLGFVTWVIFVITLSIGMIRARS